MKFTWFVIVSLGIWKAPGNALQQNNNDIMGEGINTLNENHHAVNYFQPEQIHLAFGETVKDIVVTWSTFNSTPESKVNYGEAKDGVGHLNVIGTSTLFVDGGKEKASQYIHRVTLSNLKSKTKYMYQCGSELGWSAVFVFTTVDFSTDWSPKLIVYGDLGYVNARCFPSIQKEVNGSSYSAILHVGDFAYDLHDDNGKVGNDFMNMIAPVASHIPYMVCPGNHEQEYNFSHYKNRFSMPGLYENLMYSWNLGPIHFVSINSEAYYDLIEYGSERMVLQYKWLQEDLAEANKPENRAVRPWIITYGHRPMYLHEQSSRLRQGVPFLHWYGLEKLFYDSGVDLEFWGHEHSYERSWPVYNYVVLNGSSEYPYTNPRAPVHIISGSAGSKENVGVIHRQFWSAFRSTDYGYTKLQICNHTHLYLEQISEDKDGNVIDTMWLIKEKHGRY